MERETSPPPLEPPFEAAGSSFFSDLFNLSSLIKNTHKCLAIVEKVYELY